MMDTLDKFAGISDEELLSEIQRRRDEHLAKALALGAVTAPATAEKNAARSEAARKRWEAVRAAGLKSLKDAAKAKTSKGSKHGAK